ncbi:MAG: hypothetical protein ACSHXL_08025, partial [Bacteroidota bacterium]
MKKQILIGESGGSKTDWALLSESEIIWQFSSPSLHPKNWNDEVFQNIHQQFVASDLNFSKTNLKFFGAGCNGIEKARELKDRFLSFGFNSIHISGDLKAAGIACLGDGSGFVTILGSGSVIINFKEGEVDTYFGGLGRQAGDEGGGYYFGKLVLNALREKELEPIQESILKSVLSKTEQNAVERGKITDDICLKLSHKLGNYLFEFQNFHLMNIDLFYKTYLQSNVSKDETIHFVGSYAYFYQEIIKSYFTAKGYQIGTFVPRPI